MEWGTLFSATQTIAVLGFGVLYFLGSSKREADRVTREENQVKQTDIDDAFKVRDEIIKGLEKAAEKREAENKVNIDALQKQHDKLALESQKKDIEIQGLKEEVARWKDAATNKTAIDEVRNSLKQFEFIIPMMAGFQEADAQTQKGLQEVREMVREVRQTVLAFQTEFLPNGKRKAQ